MAEALGDLPLALAQAAGYMAATGMSAAEYLELLAARAAQVLDEGRSAVYRRSLTAVTQLAFDRLRDQDPAAAELAGICAFLAPEPVPAGWFPHAAAGAARGAGRAGGRPDQRGGRCWPGSRQQALARIDQHGLVMHRLTQAILRDHLPPGQAAETRAGAVAVLAANNPGDPELPSTWPGWARLLPHLLALDPETSAAALSSLTINTVWYLIRRGDARNAYDLARRLYQHRLDQLGPDDLGTLNAAGALATVLQDLGRYDAARELDEDTLTRSRRVLGEDHPGTLASAHNLANDLHVLGDHQAARDLHEDTLTRKRRILGEDHPNTLASACNLANDLRALGDYQAARDLDEDTLTRYRRVLGEDHPNTLASADNLANDLHELGELPGRPGPGRRHPDPSPSRPGRGPPQHPGHRQQPRRSTCARSATTRPPGT